MGVTIYNRTYYQGEQMRLENGQRDLNGTHFDDNVQSLKVDDGTVVTLGRNYSLSGGIVKLYAGDYPNAIFQQDKMYSYNNPNKASSIKVESDGSSLRERQIQVFGIINWKYPNSYVFNIPVGDFNDASAVFPNDNIWKIRIPNGLKVTMWENGDKTGAWHVFDRPGEYQLKQYGLLYKVSAIKVELIDFTDAGTEFGTPEKMSEEVVATSTKDVTNKSNVEQETAVTISKDFTVEDTVSWENSGSISISAGFEIGTGEGSPVSAKITVSTTTSYSFSKSKTETSTTTRSYSAEQNVKTPPRSKTTATLVVKQGKFRIPFTKLFKNKITGEIVRKAGVLETDNSFENIVNYDKIIPLDKA